MKYLLLSIVTSLTVLTNCNFYIDDYGAIPHTDTL